MLKKHEITPELKQEVIEYAKQTSPYQAQQKYKIWSETIKYWIDPVLQTKIKNKVNEKYASLSMEEKEEVRDKHYAYLNKNKDHHKAIWKKWAEKNLDKIGATVRQHRLDNLDHYKKLSKIRYEKFDKPRARLKYKTDTTYRLKCNLREALRRALKYGDISKTMPSVQYLGCSIEECKRYLESKFQPGMTWENHGRGENCWHIDHIKPLDTMQEANLELLKELCHYTNLQPLWEPDNLTKSNKII